MFGSATLRSLQARGWNAFCGLNSARIGYDDVDVQSRQFTSETGQPLLSSVRAPILNVKILAFDIVELAKAGSKSLIVGLAVVIGPVIGRKRRSCWLPGNVEDKRYRLTV